MRPDSKTVIPSVALANGHKIPILGLGTYRLDGKVCTNMTRKAFELGYTLFDTAHLYGNHQAIAEAIKDLPREKLFLTTKLSLGQTNKAHVVKSVDKALELALKELKTPYLDLFLLHWPDRALPMVE